MHDKAASDEADAEAEMKKLYLACESSKRSLGREMSNAHTGAEMQVAKDRARDLSRESITV